MFLKLGSSDRQTTGSAKRKTADQDPAAIRDGIPEVIPDADINSDPCLVPDSVGPQAESSVPRGSGDRHTSCTGRAAPARVYTRFNDVCWSGVCASGTYLSWLVSGASTLPSKTRVENAANGRHHVDRHCKDVDNAGARRAYMSRADECGVHLQGRQGPTAGVHVSIL